MGKEENPGNTFSFDKSNILSYGKRLNVLKNVILGLVCVCVGGGGGGEICVGVNNIMPINSLLHRYSFRRINNTQLLKTLWEKEEIARNEQFLLFSQCFLLNHSVSPLVNIFDIISFFNAELEKPKIGISGKG